MKIKNWEKEIAEKLTWQKGKFYPTHEVGSGRWTHNYTSAYDLASLGLKRGLHFTTGNDAPRGGVCGDFQKLTSSGRRLKIMRNLFAIVQAEKEATEIAEKKKKLENDHAEALELDRVFEARKNFRGLTSEVKAEIARVKTAHIPPTPILVTAKQSSGLSWSEFFKLV